MIRIDAHQHYWRIAEPWHGWPGGDLPTIHRDFGPADLAPLLTAARLDGSVLVQSQACDADTEALLTLAEGEKTVLAVVGWVDMLAPQAAERIAALARHPKLRGLRPMLQDLPADWILQDAAAPALRAMVAHDLVFDALVRPVHLGAIVELAGRFPDLTIVVDHAAKPDINGCDMVSWGQGLAQVAACTNTVCKLSGLVTEAGAAWQPSDLAPYVDQVFELFGADRVMWGSDWPVVLLRASYADWLVAAQCLVPAHMHAAVFGGTAARVYGIV